MVNISNNQNQRVSVSTSNNNSVSASSPKANDVNAGTNANAQLARSWAIGEGLIQGEDYSSKYYAGKAKESADIAASAIQDIGTAKEEAIEDITDAKTDAISDMETAKEDKIAEIDNTASDFEDDLTLLTQRAETAATNAQNSADYIVNNAPTSTIEQTSTGAIITTKDLTHGTKTAIILNGQDGSDGQDGQDGAAATISVGTVTTGAAGSSASIVNSGTSSAAVFDFTIPKGDKGETGSTGATGNGIVNIEKASTGGLVDTYHVNYTNGNYDSFNVTNGKDGEGSVTDVTVNGVSVLDGSVAKVLVPTDNAQLTNGAGYITGITSSDVTTALGYTPLSNVTKYGSSLSYSSNVLQLLDQDGNGLGSSVTIQSSPDIDNKSITTNSDDELQTVGVIDQNNTSNAIKTWTGTKAQYDAIVTKDSNTLYWLTDVKIIYLGDVAVGNFKGGRNVGEIISSTLPLTDAGLHLLDGALLQYGIYKEFIDYIADLYTANPDANYFTTEALWQQSVTTYGVCGKFVYDSVANTVRLPKVTGIIEGTTDASALGDLIEAGLPAMTTGTAGGHNHSYTRYASLNGAYTAAYNNGCLGGTGDSTSWNGDHTHTINTGVRTTDTVQPQTIKAFYYIVIANSTKTEIQSDIDEITTDLNGKADTDLTNVTNKLSNNFLEKLTPDWDNRISMGLPEYPISTTANTFTCPSSGYISVHGNRSTAGYTLSVMINSIAYGQAPAYSSLFYDGFFMVNKGDVIKFITDSTSQTWDVTRQFFIPMKGAN